LRIFYQLSSPPRILGVELVDLDGRLPSPHERLSLEQAFAAEMDAAGELWEHVHSYLWERAN
jgi:hypothetical protein